MGVDLVVGQMPQQQQQQQQEEQQADDHNSPYVIYVYNCIYIYRYEACCMLKKNVAALFGCPADFVEVLRGLTYMFVTYPCEPA